MALWSGGGGGSHTQTESTAAWLHLVIVPCVSECCCAGFLAELHVNIFSGWLVLGEQLVRRPLEQLGQEGQGR